MEKIHPSKNCCEITAADYVRHAVFCGVKNDGKRLVFPSIEVFDQMITMAPEVAFKELDKSTPVLYSPWQGFQSMQNVLEAEENQREFLWRSGKLKENAKSEPFFLKYPGNPSLRQLLDSEGRVQVEDKLLQFLPDGTIVVTDLNGKPVQPDDQTSGPKNNCLMNGSNTGIQTINATDRLVGQLRFHLLPFFGGRIYVTATSTYQRLVNLPNLGSRWVGNVTPNIGLYFSGQYRDVCSDASPLKPIPFTNALISNAHQVSKSIVVHTPVTARVHRLESLHGCLILPGFFVRIP